MARIPKEVVAACQKWRIIVGHVDPDWDLLLCWWLIKTFLPEVFTACRIKLVKSGETLDGWTEADETVVHFDTGRGMFDNHGKGRVRTSSAMLLAEFLGLDKDLALADLLELSVQIDNAEEIDPMSVHYYVGFLREQCRRKIRRGDQGALAELIRETFKIFDGYHGRAQRALRGADSVQNVAQWHTTSHGTKLAVLVGRPDLTEPAFNRGADVVLWTSQRRKGQFRNVGVTVNRNRRDLSLGCAMERIAEREKKVREERCPQPVDSTEAAEFLADGEGCWYAHDSGTLILNGSRTHPLSRASQESQLTLGELVGTLKESV